jgi:hypothetical protein
MERLAQHTINGGYVSSSNPLDAPPASVSAGSKNLLFLGSGRPQVYKGPALQGGVTGSRVLYNIPDGGYAGLGTATAAGVGSIVGLIARAFAYVGGGALYVNGTSRAVNASTTAQILLYRSGAYSGASTGPYAMGLSQPTAPVIAETPTVNAEMSGTVSAVIWFVRSATGGRSRASTASAVLVVDGKKVRLTVDAADLTTASANGYDRIGIGVSGFGFGLAGPYYELTEIAISSLTTVDAVANSVEFSWTTASLAQAELAPTLDYPPPPFVFMAALEDVVAGIGAYGDATSGVSTTSPGTAIVVSLPVFIESFPPDSVLFLPEAPTGVLPRASEGFCFVACKNSLHALLYTGGRNPLSLRTVWAQVGFASQHNMTLAEGGRLYGFSSGKRGLVRIGEDGEPETKWAARVAEDTRAWVAANVIAGWDGDHQLVVFGHGQTVLAYNPAADVWCAPLDLSTKITGNLCACVTVQGGLLLAANDNTTIRLYDFNGSTGTVCEVFFPVTYSGAESVNIFRIHASLRADSIANPVRLKLYKNGSATADYDSGDITLTRTGLQILPTLRPNVRGARTIQAYFKMTGTGGNDCGPDVLELLGETSDVVMTEVAA